MSLIWLYRVAVGVLIGLALIGCVAIPSPAMRAEVAFSKPGVPDGAFKLYKSLGGVRASGTFENGRRVGVWTFWDSRGVRIVQLSSRLLENVDT